MKNIDKMTLIDFLKANDLKLKGLKTVKYTTLRNVIRWKHDGWENYIGRLPYFPTKNTITKLSLELWITTEQVKKLIENQYKVNKKTCN